MDALGTPNLAATSRPNAPRAADVPDPRRRGRHTRRWLEPFAVPFSLALGVLL